MPRSSEKGVPASDALLWVEEASSFAAAGKGKNKKRKQNQKPRGGGKEEWLAPNWVGAMSLSVLGVPGWGAGGGGGAPEPLRGGTWWPFPAWEGTGEPQARATASGVQFLRGLAWCRRGLGL